MWKKVIFLVLIIPIGFTPLFGQSDADKAVLLDQFSDNLRRFILMVDGLSDAQWNFHEEEGRWSIAEVAEHIILTEHLIFGQINEQALQSPAQPKLKKDPAQVDLMISAGVRDRSQRFQAPDPARPKGVYKTPNEAIQDFIGARSETITYLKKTDVDLRVHFADHPLGMKLDAHQWFLFMAGHADRHLKQIEQVKTHASYPSAEKAGGTY